MKEAAQTEATESQRPVSRFADKQVWRRRTSEALRMLCEDCAVSAKDLAAETGRDIRTVRKWLTGESTPSFWTDYDGLARAFGSQRKALVEIAMVAGSESIEEYIVHLVNVMATKRRIAKKSPAA